ncbi:DUF2200 domain-containing protein [Corynebacterium sp. TA-R-1]|uniref:DUF2200 domain-containing protein n=1 Tax=Corynebacterium stercoris TaxID=2943490 RepID=A0ABT1G1Z4_9CORY|nr:DUF2200 family protein [Corynebacterium stercoris]MCP1387710.1 DUF2200 domain-containing protein [Corynebacterium stercoris]
MRASVIAYARTREELDDILGWFSGLTADQLHAAADSEQTLGDFVRTTARITENAELITGSICGVKVQEVEDPTMRAIRQMDKIVDELAKGKASDKIKRSGPLE